MTNMRTPHDDGCEQDGGMTGPRYSIFSARAVFDGEITATELRVLAALGTYTNDEGWCFPNQTTLSARIGVTRQTVSAAIRRLVEKGYVETTVRTTKGRGKVGYNYRVMLDLRTGKADASTADNGDGRRRQPPTTAKPDVGADRTPMSAQASIANKEVTTPTERPQSNSKEELDCLVLTPPGEPKPKRKAKRNVVAYTPEFEAVWKLWPKNRRANSDKGKAFQRWTDGSDRFGAEKIEAAAKRYLALPNTRKDDFQYCCLVEVFMNGKLEAAVEALDDQDAGGNPTKPGYRFLGYRADGVVEWAKDRR